MANDFRVLVSAEVYKVDLGASENVGGSVLEAKEFVGNIVLESSDFELSAVERLRLLREPWEPLAEYFSALAHEKENMLVGLGVDEEASWGSDWKQFSGTGLGRCAVGVRGVGCSEACF